MNCIKNPHDFFNDLGNLHDARIESIFWLPEERRLSISIDDMNSNFEGLPEYKGCQRGTVVIEGVIELDIGIDPVDDHINIHEFTVEVVPDSLFFAEIKCWPGGKIAIKFSSLKIE